MARKTQNKGIQSILFLKPDLINKILNVSLSSKSLESIFCKSFILLNKIQIELHFFSSKYSKIYKKFGEFSQTNKIFSARGF